VYISDSVNIRLLPMHCIDDLPCWGGFPLPSGCYRKSAYPNDIETNLDIKIFLASRDPRL
jgi:hypothetical protein